MSLQELLTTPNVRSPANGTASDMLSKKPKEYSKRIKDQALKYKAPEDEE